MSRSAPTPASAPTSRQVRCAIYTRKSTDEGLDQEFNSLDAQREAAEAYIASQRHEGWVCLPDRYDDGGFSGGSMDRPALKRLLADVEAGRVDCVIVYKVDRLSRSLLDFSRIIGALDQRKASFVSVTQQFNTSTSMGRLTLNVLLSFAQFEREIIAERTRDKMGAARRRGKWTGGAPILGFDIHPDGGRLQVNETEAAQVREVFQVYLESESLLDAAREVNRRGIRTKAWTTRRDRTRGGEPFEKTALHRVLRSRLYLGQVEFGGTVYPGEHAAIVEEAVWNRVQRLLARNGRSGGRAVRNRHSALLRGLLWCAACDAAMTHTYTQKAGRRYRYYVCSRAQKEGWGTCPTGSLAAGEIDAFVVERVRVIGTDAQVVREVAAQPGGDVSAMAAALREWTPVWETLSPREQARIEEAIRAQFEAETRRLIDTFIDSVKENVHDEETRDRIRQAILHALPQEADDGVGEPDDALV